MNTLVKYLDSQITDAEWERNRSRHKLLHDCKTKGFARLAVLGRFKGGISIKKTAVRNRTHREFAEQAAELVNDEGYSLTKASDLFGRNPGDLRYHCRQFGIELRKIRKDQLLATQH